MVYFKESYNFTRFRGWGRVSNIFQEGPTFSTGDQTFSRGGGGGGGGGGRGSKC